MLASGCPSWLNSSVFYEIYPQSFYDTNGDGIGDLQGIIEKLDYIKYLGCNALWINPCFVSPFGDAGYDIADYYRVAPRYGTNDDMKRLFNDAAERGIRVCLDLVPGHTSIEHPWFVESCKPEKNEYTNRYIWTDSVFTRPSGFEAVRGYSDRDGAYVTNFFYMQPALNYGFANPDPDQPWQLPTNHPDIMAMREEIKNIMRFWLDMGASGFRVDMALSLVKNDPDATETSAIWRDVRKMLDSEYPEAAFISEWSNPKKAIEAGFHVDFLIFGTSAYHTLFRRETKMMLYADTPNMHSFFMKEGKGDIYGFLDDYLEQLNQTSEHGYISLVTGNHDFPRISFMRDSNDLAVAYAFLLTMPGVPFIYYGDEIGMQYNENLASKEGGFYRTGSRTPMQWNSGQNAGFSSALASDLYLPIDTSAYAPNIESQLGKPDSLLETTRKLIKIRSEHPALCADGAFKIIYAEHDKYPFVYLRSLDGENVLVAVNPAGKPVDITLDPIFGKHQCRSLIAKGVSVSDSDKGIHLEMDGVSYAVFQLL